jgi:hypothetical protein
MTAKKAGARVSLPALLEREHYACLLRVDVVRAFRARCAELNCSQGVFLELVLQKCLLSELVGPEDVYRYDSTARAAKAVYDALERDSLWYGNPVSKGKRAALLKRFRRMALGEVPGKWAKRARLSLEEQTRRQIANGFDARERARDRARFMALARGS